MEDRTLAAYLVRVAMDTEFAALALADPDASFAGYDLMPEDEAVLRRRDGDVLALVGRVVRQQLGLTAPPPDVASSDSEQATADEPDAAPPPPTPAGEPLPEMAVMIRLAPFAEGSGADLRVSYVASMQPVPHPAHVDDVALGLAERREPAGFLVEPGPLADITVVGLGMSGVDHLTREAERAIRASNEVLYLDTGIATSALLSEMAPTVTSLFAESYEEDAPRLGAYDHMAERVIDAAADHGPVVFAIHGHPLVGVHAPFVVARLAADRGLTVRALPGISSLDCLLADLGVDPVVGGVQMYEATDLLLRRRVLHPDVPAIIWQAGNVETRLYTSRPSRAERFHRLRAHLLRFYPPTADVVIYFASPHPLVPVVMTSTTVAQLPDHADALHVGVTLYLPPAFDRPVADSELVGLIDDPHHLQRITR